MLFVIVFSVNGNNQANSDYKRRRFLTLCDFDNEY